MSEITPERLAEIRGWAYHRREYAIIEPEIIDLLAHVDHLTAENARLREGIEGCIEHPTWHAGMYGSRWDMVRADDLARVLNPPTEGETDADA